jgi:hypothetical protein
MDKEIFKELNNFIESGRKEFEEIEARIWNKKNYNINLYEALNKRTKKELIFIGNYYGLFKNIKNIRNKKKQDLIEIFKIDYVNKINQAINKFSLAQIELLKKIANSKKGYVNIEDIDDYYTLDNIEFFVKNCILIPEVKLNERVLKMNDEFKVIFKSKVSKKLLSVTDMNTFKRSSIMGMLLHYGIIPQVELIKIYQKLDMDIEENEIKFYLNELEYYEKAIMRRDGLVISYDVPGNDIENILRNQIIRRDLKFKIYSLQEYYYTGEFGKSPLNSHTKAFIDMFTDKYNDKELSIELLMTVEMIFRAGETPDVAMEFIGGMEYLFNSENNTREIMEVLNDIYANTPQWYLKGHCPVDLEKRSKESIKRREINKRNELCGCGSGKKLKNCCGGKVIELFRDN